MECSVDSCKSNPKRLVKGMCSKHYQRQRQGKPLINEWDDAACIIDSCINMAGWGPMCRKHRQQEWNKVKTKETCSFEDCSLPLYSVQHKLCEIHSRKRRIGLRSYGRHGYIFVFNPEHPNASKKSGMVAEHRMIVSDDIGRALFSHETVHHKNGQRDDNRLENLELWSESQPAGQRVEDKINWCIEYLKENGYEM